MYEWTEKYDTCERLKTYSKIDKPVILFFGIAQQDLLFAAIVFVIIVVFSDLPHTILVAITAFISILFIKKTFREKLPKRIHEHVLWSFGLTRKALFRSFCKNKHLEDIFENRRFRRFGP